MPCDTGKVEGVFCDLIRGVIRGNRWVERENLNLLGLSKMVLQKQKLVRKCRRLGKKNAALETFCNVVKNLRFE